MSISPSLMLLLASPVAGGAPDCTYDLDAMLALDQQQFDQTLQGGWRPLALRGCNPEAAELIREWRYRKRAHGRILYWHEGQLRALAGQTQEALALFHLTYLPPSRDRDFGWNHYVEGTIAFLQRDRQRLRNAIASLAEVPPPDDLVMTLPDGTTRTMDWPPNMRVLVAFDRCWDDSYAIAYAPDACAARDTEDIPEGSG